MVTAFLLVEDRFDEMVAMKYLLGKYLTLVMEIIDADTVAVLGKEDIDVAVGRVTVKLTLDVTTQTGMAVAEGYRLTAQIIIEAT